MVAIMNDHKPSGLTTTQISFPYRSGGQKPNVQQISSLGDQGVGKAAFLPEGSREESIFVVSDFQRPPAFLAPSPLPSSKPGTVGCIILPPYHFDLPFCLPLPFLRTLVMTLSSTGNPGSTPYFKVRSLAILILFATLIPLCHIKLTTYSQVPGIRTGTSWGWGRLSCLSQCGRR